MVCGLSNFPKHLVIFQILLLLSVCLAFNIELLSPAPVLNGAKVIYKEGNLQHEFDDVTYNNQITCVNNQFTIIQFFTNQTSPQIKIAYDGFQISSSDITIKTIYPQPLPSLSLIDVQKGQITFNAGCLGNQTNRNNYFNKIDIYFQILTIFLNPQGEPQQQKQMIEFSFLLGCDRGGRNKKFEVGYIFIAIINAAITIGVALHSRIWSIRINRRPLSIQLKWHRYLLLIIIVVVCSIVFYIVASEQFLNANIATRYAGLIISYLFCFVCADQLFYLFKPLKTQVFKIIRVCDVLSFVVSTSMMVAGYFFNSWIYYDILAVGVCVGAIKLFRFSSMKQAYISMLINVITVSTIAIIFHFILERSYNDYASQFDSPLFIMIPDLIGQLYKKCSWLPVLDVIVPGVFLSFLRSYDQNYNTGWGGVYTVIGNLSFILSTILWVILQAVYPYSVPFSLVTYIILAFAIWVISRKRNEFETLWQGRFNGANNQLSTHLLINSETSSNRVSFSKLVGRDIIDAVKFDSALNQQYDSIIQRDPSNIKQSRKDNTQSV